MNMKMAWSCCTVAAILAAGAAVASDKDRVIANEGRIGDRWALADGVQLAMAQYPAALAARGDDVCIALAYQINEDGTTSDFAVLRQWNSATEEKEPMDGYFGQFAQAAADALSQWRFKAKEGVVARPTYTVATVGFNGGKRQDPGFASHCRIGDLTAFLQNHRSDSIMNRSSARRDMERASRDAQANSSIRNTLQRGPTR
jgi:hypothetical protein